MEHGRACQCGTMIEKTGASSERQAPADRLPQALRITSKNLIVCLMRHHGGGEGVGEVGRVDWQNSSQCLLRGHGGWAEMDWM